MIGSPQVVISPVKKKNRSHGSYDPVSINLDDNFRRGSLFDISPTSDASHGTMESEIARLNFISLEEDLPYTTMFRFLRDDSDESSTREERTKSVKPQSCGDSELKIVISPPVKNRFLVHEKESRPRRDFKSKNSSTSIWISPFEERPRYMVDFEQEGFLGEGSFASVYKARRRLDGCLYAVKKVKRSLSTLNAKRLALQEVCALAALQGCSRIIRYYGCWVEDSHLWIQTELCLQVIYRLIEIYICSFVS